MEPVIGKIPNPFDENASHFFSKKKSMQIYENNLKYQEYFKP